MEEYYKHKLLSQSTMSNPTLINGFEDIITFIKQQEHRNQKLQEENNQLKKKFEVLNSVQEAFRKQMREEMNILNKPTEKLKEENKKLQEEVDDLKGRLEDVNHTAEEWEDSYNELKQESEESYNELKQELEKTKKYGVSVLSETLDQERKNNEELQQELEKTKKYAQDTPGIFHCGVSGRVLTEDDIHLSVEHGRLICEAALEDEQQEQEKELIPVNRKILIQDFIIKNMLYKLLCDGEEAEIEIPKNWRVDGVDSFTLEYSDIMEKVCKEMDDDDWNDDGSNLTLDWHNDTLEVVFPDESE